MMKREDKQQIVNMLALISQLGITMLVSIMLGTFAGMFIDKELGTNYISVIGFFIGSAGGFRSVYIMVKKYLRKKQERLNEVTEKIK